MLQVDICPFASDALEDAMRLAQTKSLNSYSFSDCLNYLNYVWSDIYSAICTVDAGYYSKTIKLTKQLTKLPKFVKNSIMIYSAQNQLDYNRRIYRAAGPTDQVASGTYTISGTDLYCYDAIRRPVWLEYCPQPPQIFFTHHNRDPKVYSDGYNITRNSIYNLYKLQGSYIDNDETKIIDVSDATVTQGDISKCTTWQLLHRNHLSDDAFTNDISENVIREGDDDGEWQLKFISCDYPYIFCSYQHNVTGEWVSGFFNKQLEWTKYNPFEWTGRPSNVEYLACHYNDKTGMGVVVNDWNDLNTVLKNIDILPSEIDDVIGVNILLVDNYFEYKGTDGTVTKFTQGYWYNRYNTDFNYTKVPVVDDYPEAPDLNDVILLDNNLWQYKGLDDANKPSWELIVRYKEVAQKETLPIVKELGWTPDTRLVYPAPEVYRYLVARLAEKFAALNESNIMGVQSELADARFAFFAFLKKDKSSWERMRNVNPPTLTDWL